ncbi:hypothetical protein BJF79_30555 [Actinomadura sp. CNU-125]|uniref:alpha/beta fold hydrolase n=1 Tax=Actinomadura sp. CNU-125 TaxID=1904961 RepID=UPI00095B4854|nr:alpha/beta fold hydrolase [Actinomadura sp. CNU-125]OLT36896.1 hypothetical protein BJF79_30555 [Actinomadura sp. CNU-125]
MGGYRAEGPQDAAERTRVRHLLVLLPGILGSSLRREGKVVWGLSADMHAPIRNPELLAAGYDALCDPEHDDGVRPDGLLSVPVPYLSRVLGPYGALRRELHRRFELDDLNYLEFPYDWRRPVAVNSARLARAIRARRAALAEHVPDPRVVIVAHSMGGLVATHYLRHHDDDGDCHRIITVGTPFRGSVKALDYLVNGPNFGPRRLRGLAETLRDVPGVYDLLPMYRTVADRRSGRTGEAVRPAELVDGLDLDAARVRASRDFLADLNAPHERSWLVHPLVGYGQRTLQQATLRAGGRLKCSKDADLLPPEYTARDGDGTVPVVSARPGAREGVVVGYGNDSHNGLVDGGRSADRIALMLTDVLDGLDEEDPALAPGGVLPPPGHDPGVPRAGRRLSLDVDELYPAEGTVRVTGRADGHPPDAKLWARLSGIPNAAGPADVGADGTFRFDFGTVEPGVRTLSVADTPEGPAAINDVIEVA